MFEEPVPLTQQKEDASQHQQATQSEVDQDMFDTPLCSQKEDKNEPEDKTPILTATPTSIDQASKSVSATDLKNSVGAVASVESSYGGYTEAYGVQYVLDVLEKEGILTKKARSTAIHNIMTSPLERSADKSSLSLGIDFGAQVQPPLYTLSYLRKMVEVVGAKYATVFQSIQVLPSVLDQSGTKDSFTGPFLLNVKIDKRQVMYALQKTSDPVELNNIIRDLEHTIQDLQETIKKMRKDKEDAERVSKNKEMLYEALVKSKEDMKAQMEKLSESLDNENRLLREELDALKQVRAPTVVSIAPPEEDEEEQVPKQDAQEEQEEEEEQEERVQERPKKTKSTGEQEDEKKKKKKKKKNKKSKQDQEEPEKKKKKKKKKKSKNREEEDEEEKKEQEPAQEPEDQKQQDQPEHQKPEPVPVTPGFTTPKTVRFATPISSTHKDLSLSSKQGYKIIPWTPLELYSNLANDIRTFYHEELPRIKQNKIPPSAYEYPKKLFDKYDKIRSSNPLPHASMDPHWKCEKPFSQVGPISSLVLMEYDCKGRIEGSYALFLKDGLFDPHEMCGDGVTLPFYVLLTAVKRSLFGNTNPNSITKGPFDEPRLSCYWRVLELIIQASKARNEMHKFCATDSFERDMFLFASEHLVDSDGKQVPLSKVKQLFKDNVPSHAIVLDLLDKNNGQEESDPTVGKLDIEMEVEEDETEQDLQRKQQEQVEKAKVAAAKRAAAQPSLKSSVQSLPNVPKKASNEQQVPSTPAPQASQQKEEHQQHSPKRPREQDKEDEEEPARKKPRLDGYDYNDVVDFVAVSICNRGLLPTNQDAELKEKIKASMKSLACAAKFMNHTRTVAEKYIESTGDEAAKGLKTPQIASFLAFDSFMELYQKDPSIAKVDRAKFNKALEEKNKNGSYLNKEGFDPVQFKKDFECAILFSVCTLLDALVEVESAMKLSSENQAFRKKAHDRLVSHFKFNLDGLQ